MKDMEEEWRPVVGYEGAYEVSNLGRVRSVDRTIVAINRFGNPEPRRYQGKLLRPGPARSGHVSVAIRKGRSRSVHTLVLEAFVGPAPAGCECLHKDGDPTNNCVENLRWGTRSENLIDMFYHGQRKVDAELIRVLRRKAEEGFYHGEKKHIAERFGVSQTTVSSILTRRAYGHVG